MMAWYWAAWLLVGFGVPEGIALGTGHGENTLSDTVWRMEGQGWTFVRYLVLVLLVWLVLHMVWKVLR